MNPFNATAATVQQVKDDLNVSVVMYFDSQDIQIKLEGKCTGASKICDGPQPWTHCASGAMPCCYSYNCDAFNTTMCPPDDYAAALARVFPQRLALRELPGPNNTRPIPICPLSSRS
jgi:hypothetical protein